jgi:hypothetical protein
MPILPGGSPPGQLLSSERTALIPDTWHVYDHYAYAFVAMGGTFAAVWVIGWLMQHPRWSPWVHSLRGVVPPFINIIGVLFGLTLAFLANDTWSAHDRAMNAVYKEADALRSLMVFSGKLPEPMGTQFRADLANYANASADEWTNLAHRTSSLAVSARADHLLTTIGSATMLTAVGDNVQALMLRKASDIRDERDLRIGLSQTHINPLKWLGMAFLGLVTLISVAVVHAENARAAMVAILLFALAAAPTAAIVLIQGNPFQQPSSVSPDPIRAAVAHPG